MATDPAVTPTAEQFIRNTTMRSILEIDQQPLDHIMATAFLLYQAGRYREVDVLCRGLIATDHTYWWSYSLHAAALRRLGRLDEALEQVDSGLMFDATEPKLLLMRGEILAAIGRWKDRAIPTDSTALSASPALDATARQPGASS
jgi:tetratricopeptide (TPR) repeat protein